MIKINDFHQIINFKDIRFLTEVPDFTGKNFNVIKSTPKDKRTPEDKAAQEALKAAFKIPNHIAVIMDGNGRWAKSQGKPRVSGHHAGVESVRDTVEACAELGVKFLTLYAFSTENWGRPKDEVSALMSLLIRSLKKELKTLNDNNIRLQTIGNREDLPRQVREELEQTIEATVNNDRMTLVLALSYSGRWDITTACKEIANLVLTGKIKPDEITSEMISSNLSTKNIPDPDLMIRTSGEMRISNFLLWQLAYSEFYITESFWPEFRRNKLYEAIKAYNSRERRFGKVSEQINEN